MTPSCIYNDTSEWQLEVFPQQQPGWSIEVFNANGSLPNGYPPIYAAVGLPADQVVAVGSGTNAHDPWPSHYVAFAVGNGSIGRYGPLNDIQCQLVYDPADFSVNVNVNDQTIEIIPLPQQKVTPPNIFL